METLIKKALLMRSTMYRDIQEDVLSSLTSLAETHSLDAKSLASKLDRFMTVSRPDSSSVSIEDVQAFGKEQSASKAKVASNVFAKQSWEDVDMEDAAEALNPNQRISPYLSKVVTAPAQAAQAKAFIPQGPGKFKERCANGAVHSILNEHIPAVSVADEGKAAAEIEILGDSVAVGARFMVDRIADKAAYIDHRISTFEREVEAACGEGYPHAVATAAQNPTIFVGRICCDTEDGRLNPQSVVLEGSSGLSHGARVKVDLSGCRDYRLFPGQVACIKGTNPSGFCIVASEVLPGLPLKSAAKAEKTVAGDQGDTDSFSCMVAAGPYTTSEDLLYEPLAALLEYATAHKPDVLLLAGPFVDAEHAMIRGGLLEETFDQIYESRVAAQLGDFSSRVGGSTCILLLPSPKDIHHDPTFPQGPMTVDTTTEEQLTNLPNPCTFKCNDVVMGCSSVDWLMSCTKEEISQASKPADRLPSMASHIINQRTYFPMFPPPANVPMDTSRGYGLELPCTPNVLVAPSDLAPFAKVVAISQPALAAAVAENTNGTQENGTADAAMADVAVPDSNVIFINPGRVTKGTTAGTFVHMWVAGQDSDKGVESRCRVEVKKL